MFKILLILFVIFQIYPLFAGGITLDIIRELSLPITDENYDPYHVRFPSKIFKSDTIVVGTIHGIWKSSLAEQLWIKLMNWPPDIYEYGHITDIVAQLPPQNIYYIDSTVIFVDPYYRNIYRLEETIDDDYAPILWRSSTIRKRKGYFTECFNNIEIYKNEMVIGLEIIAPDSDSNLVALQRIDETPEEYYKRIFKCPESLLITLSTNGIKYPYSIPAYNPHDNTIWVAVYGYEYIYIVDTFGVLHDSVFIYGPDYVKPSPPRSRIKSKAVWKDWLSRWTPLDNFHYVQPGFFILQYRTGFRMAENDTIPIFSTLIWDQENRRVNINIDENWQLAGVHRDGRLIFAHYQVQDGKKEIRFKITRIENEIE